MGCFVAAAIAMGASVYAEEAAVQGAPIAVTSRFQPKVSEVRMESERVLSAGGPKRDVFDLAYSAKLEDDAPGASPSAAPSSSVFRTATPNGSPDITPGAKVGDFGKPPSPLSGLRLTGVAIFGESAAATIDDGTGPRAYRVNDAVGGHLVAQIFRDRVVFHDGGIVTMSLGREADRKASSLVPDVPSRDRQGTVGQPIPGITSPSAPAVPGSQSPSPSPGGE